jgi:hypothetical protein
MTLEIMQTMTTRASATEKVITVNQTACYRPLDFRWLFLRNKNVSDLFFTNSRWLSDRLQYLNTNFVVSKKSEIQHDSKLLLLNTYFFPPMERQPLVGQGLLNVEVWRSPHSVGLLWTSNQTSTWQHTTLTRDRHPLPRRNSNLQSHQSSGRIPTPLIAQPLASAEGVIAWRNPFYQLQTTVIVLH